MAKKQYPEDLYMSPCLAIKRFAGLRAKYGETAVKTRGDLQQDREAWVTAVFLLGVGKRTAGHYWLRSSQADPPDTLAVTFLQGQRGVEQQLYHIEVFEYEEHRTLSLTDAIKEKLDAKVYPDYYHVVGYVHGRRGQEFNVKEAADTVKVFAPKVASIWILFSTAGAASASYALASVFPEPDLIRFDYEEECDKTSQADFLTSRRGPQRKSNSSRSVCLK
ncbi:MAG: hypothetical protein HYX92_16755 [Chloroflexi bacterium]|nr:hypothetical protein [Chloroflexota bacterium]